MRVRTWAGTPPLPRPGNHKDTKHPAEEDSGSRGPAVSVPDPPQSVLNPWKGRPAKEVF